MLPNLIALTLKVTYSDFWRYIVLGLIAIYMFLPMQATPLAFACVVSGVTVCVWSAVSLAVWTSPNTFRMQCWLGQRRAVVAVLAA